MRTCGGGPELTVCRGCGRRFYSTGTPYCSDNCAARELDELRQSDGLVYDDGRPEDE